MPKQQLIPNVFFAASSRKNLSGWLTLIALLLGGLAVSASAQNRPVARVEPEKHFTVPPDVPTAVVLMTQPAAACDLHAAGVTDPSHTMRLDANTEGYVRFHFTPKQDIQDAQLQLDCASQGALTTHPLHLRIAASPTLDMPAPEHSVPIPKGSTIRPALTEESARQLSDQSIIAQGYPPRPNAAESPEAYAEWLGRVSRPMTILPPDSMSRSENSHSRHGVGEGPADQNNSHWSGFMALNQGSYGSYLAAQGSWAIPTVRGDPSNPGKKCYSSVWAGIGGWTNSSTLVQAGTEQDATDVITGTATSYYAWTEVYPAQLSNHKAFEVDPGNTLEVAVYVGDSHGNVNPSGGYAWFNLIYDGPAGILFSKTTYTALGTSGYAISGDSVEWVVERPCLSCGTGSVTFPEFADYGSVEMIGAYAVLPGPGTNAVAYSKVATQRLTMRGLNIEPYDDDNVLSTVAEVTGCPDCMKFYWKNFH